MNKYLLPIMILVVISLSGCAGLQGMLTDIPTTDATAEIGAVATLAGDFIPEPYQSSLLLVLGYGAALLRRWYKKKQGAKNV